MLAAPFPEHLGTADVRNLGQCLAHVPGDYATHIRNDDEWAQKNNYDASNKKSRIKN